MYTDALDLQGAGEVYADQLLILLAVAYERLGQGDIKVVSIVQAIPHVEGLKVAQCTWRYFHIEQLQNPPGLESNPPISSGLGKPATLAGTVIGK